MNRRTSSIIGSRRKEFVVLTQILCCLCIGIPIWGQDTLLNEEIKILKDFDAQMARVHRIRNYPKPLPADTIIRKEVIHPKRTSIEIPISLNQLDYPLMDLPDEPGLYSSYISLGGGFPRRIHLSAGHTIQKEGTYELGIKANINQAETKNIQYQGYKDQDFHVSGRYFFDPEWDIRFHSGIERDIRYIYGHPEADSLNAAALRRRVTIYNLGFRGQFDDHDSNRSFSTGIALSQLQDSYATSERKLIIDGVFTPLRNAEHQLDLQVTLDFTSLTDTLVRKLNNYLFKPNYQYLTDVFTANVGINVYNHRDVFSYYPDLEVKLPVSGNQLIAIAGINGDLVKNDYHSLYRFNNFVQSRIDTLTNTSYYDFFLGVDGALHGWQYSVRAGWKIMEDFSLFQFEQKNDNAGFFRVLFDDVNTSYLQLQLVWQPTEELLFDIDLAAYFYGLSFYDQAWHRSNLQYSALAKWNPSGSRFSFSGQLWIEGGMPYLNEDGSAATLPTIVDLSLEGRYQFFESFDAFLQLNNLVNTKWSRWINYPQFGTNLLMGIRYRVKG